MNDKTPGQPSIEIPDPAAGEGLGDYYFEFLAEMGITKHMGSLNSTLALIEACHIGPGQYVLDVGCGVGITPCYLAKRYGCPVVGIDITPKMIDRSRTRAKREGLEDTVEFKVADARHLPFKDDLFDAVIVESVLVFLADRERALRECVRVAKPGGYVGLNEMALLKEPPPPELLPYFAQTIGMLSGPPTADVWKALLEDAGLRDAVARAHQVDFRQEAKGRLKRFGLRDMLGALWRSLHMYVTKPAARAFVKQSLKGVNLTPDLFEYLGYGICVGVK